MSQSQRAYLGLGANLGDAASTLRSVLEALRDTDGVLDCLCSPFYRTAPVEATGPDYINAVAVLHTTLAPLALLDVLQTLENQHGRQRPYKNAPRTLDLDLLLYGDMTIETPRLAVPHPRMHERAFVLAPLHDIAPALRLNQGPVAELLARLSDQPIERLT